MIQNIVIVDMDGTLADIQHRLHYVTGPGKKRWKQFFRAMDRDEPIDVVVRWVRNLAPEYITVIITGRTDEYRKLTEDWLETHGIKYAKLLMRREGDHRPDTVVKRELLDTVGRERVAFAIDDLPAVCAMYRECGLRVFQVSSGQGR